MTIWQEIKSILNGFYLPQITPIDIVEIIIIVFAIYQFVKSIKNTRTFVLLKAISILFFVYFIAELLSFDAITVIFQSLTIVAMVAIIVIFQPELRRTLEKLGTTDLAVNFSLKNLINRKKTNNVVYRYSDKTIEEISDACFSLGAVKTGALIVMEKDIPLNDYISTGINLNADITAALLINVFEKNTPLHDGALITNGNKMIAATCYLPLSDNPSISKHLGTRHRAAIGVSELTDCNVIVVSEETGKVSFVENGKISVCKSKEDLASKLKKSQIKEQIMKKKIKMTDNLGSKFTALAIGVIGWILIMNSVNPITTKVIYDVPVRIENEDAIASVGKTYSITSGQTVNVIVKDNRSIVDVITAEDIIVTADMSKLSYVFSVPLSASSVYPTTEVSFVNDNTITVEVDDIIAKEFALTFNKLGNASNGYYVSKLTSATDGIVITGAEKIINTIDKVVFNVDVTGARENFSQKAEPVVYDKNGNVIDRSQYVLNKPSIIVNAELLNTKRIPLKITLAMDENIERNYELSIDNYKPTYISVAASDDLLDSIAELEIEIKSDINATDVINDIFTKEINLEDYLPDGFYCAEKNNKVNIEIKYEPFKTKDITFSSNDIVVQNQDNKLNLTFKDSSYTIQIMGTKETLQKVDISTMIPYIDLKDLKEGLYNLPVMFENLDGVKIKTNINVNIELIPKDKK